MKKYLLKLFVVGYLDAVWFLVFGYLDKNEIIGQEWLVASVVAITITHIVIFIIIIIAAIWSNHIEYEKKKLGVK